MQKSLFHSSLGNVVTVCAALLLAGCAADEISSENIYVPSSTEERYPIEYAKGPVTMVVETQGSTLQPAQVNAVSGFARQSANGGLTPVTIKRPAGGGASARIAQEIAGLLMQNGLPQNMIRMGTYPAPASAPVKLTYVKAYAKTRECGDWSRDATTNSSNTQMPNHGCAVQANIAAMIADPSDIAMPSPSTLAPSEAGVVAVNNVAKGQAAASSDSSSN